MRTLDQQDDMFQRAIKVHKIAWKWKRQNQDSKSGSVICPNCSNDLHISDSLRGGLYVQCGTDGCIKE